MKRIAAALAAFALVALAIPAHAGQLVDFAVVSRATGQRLPVYHHEGRLYVPGTPGERYAVYVANRTAQRVLAVVSVDGINVITGDTAATGQDGYVLAPGQSFEINGWRKNMSEVASFYFTRLPDSYAARTDRPANVGVIGVAAFREWQPRRPRSVPQSRGSADNAAAEADSPGRPEAGAARREEKIGTGHGTREQSEVVHTEFRRATDHPSETLVIHYDTRANLLARGVIPREPRLVEPNPFPAGRFAPDPRG